MDKIKTYYTGGTVGDAYIILCKLYSVAMREPILCRHYTKHENVRPVIKEIYELVPNIKVEFLDDPLPGVRMSGAFQDCVAEKAKWGIEPEYYPEFELESIACFNLPETYVVLQTIAGIRRDREVSIEFVEEILANVKLPVVLVGEVDKRINLRNDVRGRTSIKQDINIIKSGKLFYGMQGFLSYVAVSQKVHSTVFVDSKSQFEINGLRARIEAVEPWRKYLTKR